MQEVIAFQSIDGKLFASREACLNHECSYLGKKIEIQKPPTINQKLMRYIVKHGGGVAKTAKRLKTRPTRIYMIMWQNPKISGTLSANIYKEYERLKEIETNG